MDISFSVSGKPQPQGSVRAFMPKGWTRPVLTSDNKTLKPWRKEVAKAASAAMGAAQPSEKAIGVAITFRFVRPKSVKKSVEFKLTKPDVDKLARGILDSLTGVCFKDDSQVVKLLAVKGFSDSDGADIRVFEMQMEEGW